MEQILESVPDYSPAEKLDYLLELIANGTPKLGDWSNFNADRDYPLLVASGPHEVNYLIDHLLKRELLHGNRQKCALSMDGWERLDQIRRSGRSSSRAFVAMWFQESTDEAYDKAIAPAIRDAGYEPLRIDRHEHVNRIDDEIVAQIRRSRFMVADFTGQRGGVYFEAGLMMGLGRRVFWMCKKEELKNLHFDTNHYNFIDYDGPEDAKNRLYFRILAVEGEGPLLSS